MRLRRAGAPLALGEREVRDAVFGHAAGCRGAMRARRPLCRALLLLIVARMRALAYMPLPPCRQHSQCISTPRRLRHLMAARRHREGGAARGRYRCDANVTPMTSS